uniref:Chemokine interleukin-8-like domain-containing protein n=1 Tax=Denticeps clupeoides TaxID=299321 RepID=A0A8C4AQ47_9TELE
MKTFCLLTAAVLLVALCSSALASRPSECCMNFYQNRVPLRQIKSFTVTHPSCPKKGVVLTTLRGIKMSLFSHARLIDIHDHDLCLSPT